MNLGHPILMILWQLGTYQENHCRFFEETMICEGIQQEDFLYQVYKNKDYLTNHPVYYIEIVNSNFSHIKSFSKPPQFSADVSRLSIRNSSIQSIEKDAFQGFRTIDLDLSDNYIEDISFIDNLYLRSLNLKNNRIKVLDLNISGAKFENISSIILKGNNMEDIISSNAFRIFQSVDLSFNQINAFNETNLNCFFLSIDLSYNNLDTISVLDTLTPERNYFKNVINLAGNNISSLGAYTDQSFTCNELYLTSVPIELPQTFNVQKVFSLANARIGLLNTSVFNISMIRGSWYDIDWITIDFSNSSISEISEFYLEGVRLSLLNLSHNNFISLNSSIFKDSSISHLDLSFSKLKALSDNAFEGLSYCNILNLTGNLLESIDNICNFVKFSTIDLSHNKIDTIGVDAFVNCTELRVLNISHSEINYIESGSFANLSSLRFLDLSNNFITNLKEDSFSNLPNINTIDLSGNRMGVLETNTFRDLSVRNLILSNTTIKYIQNRAFHNLDQLITLNLSSTGIAFLEQDCFFNLSSLKTIDLSYNDLTTVESHTFNNLGLSNLYLDGNRIKIIKSRAFENLYSLKILNLSSLEIQVLEPFSFSRLSVVAIDLRDNNISEIQENIFSNITGYRIYLDNNNISSISLDDSVNVKQMSLNFNGVLRSRAFSNFYLKSLFLNNSLIELLMDNSFMGLFSLEELHLNGSIIDSYEPGALNGLFSLKKFDASDLFRNNTIIETELFSEMSELNSLLISNVYLTEIQPGAFYGLEKLNELYLSNNNLSSVNGSVFDNLKSLNLLDLSNNLISSIDLPSILNGTENLKTLRLSLNRLKSIRFSGVQNSTLESLFVDNNLIQSINSSTFQGLTGLKILHLQNNGLRTISYGTFRNLSNLIELRLNGNGLYSLNIDIFGGLGKLRILDLSENPKLFQQTADFNLMGLKSSSLNIINLDNTYLESIDYVSLRNNNGNLQEIAINYNRFSCSTLSTMLEHFADVGVNYSPKNPRYDIKNIDGIVCDYSG